jgi:integrase
VRFHDLRHTCATLLFTRGVHPKIVSEMLGHSSVSITLDVCSHVIPGLGDAAALAMEDALGK